MEPTLESRFSKAGSPMTAIWAERAAFSSLKFRDSKCLNQAIDSRFRGMTASAKVTCLAEMMSFPRSLCPRKRVAGIHFGQRTPKFELVKGTAGPELGMGGFAESVGAVREIASEPGSVARNRARPIKRGRGPGHRTSRPVSSFDQIGPRPGEGGLAGPEPGASECSYPALRRESTPAPGTAPGHSGTIGRAGAHRMPGRTESIDDPGVCVGRRMRGSLPYVIMIGSDRRTKMEGCHDV